MAAATESNKGKGRLEKNKNRSSDSSGTRAGGECNRTKLYYCHPPRFLRDCGICVGTDESIDHVLRCSPFARTVWSKVNSHAHDPSFFLSNFKKWWEDNITKSGGNINFGITCWIIWRARNERVFQEANTSPDAILEQVKFWQGIILNAQEMTTRTRNLTSGVREM
ncbi:hypothetical protein LINPERHAP2_LOCUS5093 [Linum perenne]